MTEARSSVFRIAVRKFSPFETAIGKQWDAFCAATGCRLRLEAVPLDLHPLHETLLEKGGLKDGTWDAAFVVTDWLSEAHAAGALRDLAPTLREHPPEGYPSAWPESLLRHQTFGDAVLALPYHDGPECLIYRTDLLSAAGLGPPRTWEEFHVTARRLTDPGAGRWGTVFAAYPDGHNTVYDFCLQLWTRGGELFDAGGLPRIETPVAIESLAYYRAILADSTAVHPRCRDFDSVQSGLAFARGEVAMMVNWFGFAALAETLEESNVKGHVRVALPPAAPGHASASLNVYWLLAVAAGSCHAEVSTAFLRHCAGATPDRQLTLDGGIGCRKSTWHDAEVNGLIPFYRDLENLHAHARELPRLVHWARIAEVIDQLVTRTIDTDRPIAELCREAQRSIERLTLS